MKAIVSFINFEYLFNFYFLLKSRLRTSVIRFACARAHEDCINKARALYAEWMKTPQENKSIIKNIVIFWVFIIEISFFCLEYRRTIDLSSIVQR